MTATLNLATATLEQAAQIRGLLGARPLDQYAPPSTYSLITFTDPPGTIMVDGNIGKFYNGQTTHAFDYEPMSVVVIGTSCKRIEAKAFGGSGADKLVLPEGLEYIGNENFGGFGRPGTTLVVPSTVTYIGNTVFRFGQWTTVRILGPITALNGWTFAQSGYFRNIYLPATVTAFGGAEFLDTGATHIYFEGNAPTLGGDDFAACPATLYYKPGTTGWTNPFGGRPTAEWTSYPDPMP